MSPPDDNFPAPPDLPSFTVEDAVDTGPPKKPAPRSSRRPLERHAGTGLVRHDGTFDDERIDPDAAKVVRRLERSGHEAYLVGGCVRDLLLGSKPKDFDVATSARPEDVRALFRNCRIIGRRFRLAHILFGGGQGRRGRDVPAQPGDGSPRGDRERGPRRPAHPQRQRLRRGARGRAPARLHDERALLRPRPAPGARLVRRDAGRRGAARSTPSATRWSRFREDPIRILRAIKFAARLDLGIAPDVYDAMVATREDLAKAARPRVFEEILRLLRGGAAHRSMWLLWETGAMAVLLPELAAFLDDEEATAGRRARASSGRWPRSTR